MRETERSSRSLAGKRLMVAAALSAVLQAAAVPVATAQVTAPPPKVLSIVPDPPAGAVAEPVQMSGMPLQVGDLPPGIVVVRVIRRSFAENLPNQRVELRAVPSGRAVSAVTDASGRAQFSGQSIGSMVAASAVIDGERLDSEVFEIPAQGGVRMVLAAGVGAGTPAGARGATPSTATSVPAVSAPVPVGALVSGRSPAAPVADDVITLSMRRTTLTALATLGVVGGGALVFMGWRRRDVAAATTEVSRAGVEGSEPVGAVTDASAARAVGGAGRGGGAPAVDESGGGRERRRAEAFQETRRTGTPVRGRSPDRRRVRRAAGSAAQRNRRPRRSGGSVLI